jgi:hypothetical protein
VKASCMIRMLTILYFGMHPLNFRDEGGKANA